MTVEIAVDENELVPLTSRPDHQIDGDVGVGREASGPAEDRLLPWSKVREITGFSRTTAWREQKKGAFPAPVVISPRRVGWRESEVAAWWASRPRSASQPNPEPNAVIEPTVVDSEDREVRELDAFGAREPCADVDEGRLEDQIRTIDLRSPSPSRSEP